MTYVSWDDKLATGIEDIDTDHKTLFDLVDQFHDAYAAGHGSEELEAVFATLMDYTDHHFRREEEFMKSAGFPGLEEHRKTHEELKAEVLALHQRYLKGELQGQEKDLCLEILAFLSNWLHFHIAEEDMEYRDFFQQSGKNA